MKILYLGNSPKINSLRAILCGDGHGEVQVSDYSEAERKWEEDSIRKDKFDCIIIDGELIYWTWLNDLLQKKAPEMRERTIIYSDSGFLLDLIVRAGCKELQGIRLIPFGIRNADHKLMEYVTEISQMPPRH